MLKIYLDVNGTLIGTFTYPYCAFIYAQQHNLKGYKVRTIKFIDV